MAKRIKFGVYFDGKLIDTIEATSVDEAREIANSEVKQVPAQLKYKEIILDESSVHENDELDESFYNGFHVKMLKKR